MPTRPASTRSPLPALEEAAKKGSESNQFFADFYLARIYSDASGGKADRAKAYKLFRKLADENADADPDEGHRAPFVAKALTALAGYLRTGVPELGVKPDIDRAVECLQNAATSFGDQEAQFELAKTYLSRGGDDDVKLGKHFLSVLARDGFANAQAFLADMYWRGRYVKKDDQRALALITMASENAPAARPRRHRCRASGHLLRHLAGPARPGRQPGRDLAPGARPSGHERRPECRGCQARAAADLRQWRDRRSQICGRGRRSIRPVRWPQGQ